MTIARDIAAWVGSTDTTKGPVELATQAEVDAGTDTERAVTPSALAGAAMLGRLIDVQVFTSSGTWTKPAGTKMIRTRIQAGGGGGGGVAGRNPGGYAGGGGSGGRFREDYVLDEADLNSSHTITVGSGGAGGASGDNDGAAGSTSSFGTVGQSAYHYANGGNGGKRGTSGNGGTTLGSGQGSGVTQIRNYGQPGSRGLYSPNTGDNPVSGGIGGDSHFGSGGSPGAGTSGIGQDATGYGGGGGGGHTVDSTSSLAGGDGSDGVVIVESYS